MRVGNTLTLLSHHTIISHSNGVAERRDYKHRFLNIPRKIISATSQYVTIGDEKSVLEYPSKAEYSEDADTQTFTLTLVVNPDIVMYLVYKYTLE